MERHQARRLIYGSAAIGSLGTFGMHVLLPSLPAIGREFAAPAATTQLLISLAMVSIALGNLTVAPLSDRFGRRPVTLVGLGLYIAGSLAGILAPGLGWLIAARIVQAFGGGAAMAVARATLNDYFGPERAASAVAYTAMAILVVPMFAPAVGGLTVQWAGWRAVFLLATLLGVGVLAFALLKLGETHGVADEDHRPPGTFASYRLLVADRGFLLYLGFGGCMLATVYAFITGAPYVAIELLGLSPATYGLWDPLESTCRHASLSIL